MLTALSRVVKESLLANVTCYSELAMAMVPVGDEGEGAMPSFDGMCSIFNQNHRSRDGQEERDLT